MSDLFNNVKPGDVVHYSTPQGQYGKGKVVMNRGTHVVINRGKGQPQVVTDKNYVKHERGGKVVGAVLSKVAAHDKYLKSIKEASLTPRGQQREKMKQRFAQQNKLPPTPWSQTPAGLKSAASAKKIADREKARREMQGNLKEDTSASGTFAKLSLSAAAGKDDATRKEIERIRAARKFGKIADALQRKKVERIKEERINEISKELAKRYVIAAVKDINYSSREAEGARTAAYADYMNKKAVKRSNAIAKNTKAMRAYKDHVFGKDIYKEDAKDLEGKSARVAKTKNKKKAKKLDEVSNTTLTNYVYKAIQDRKKNTIRSKNAWLVHGEDDPERARSVAKAAKQKAEKRHAGIKKAVAKIASNLPAEPLKAHSESEGTRHGGWSGMESVVNEVSAPGKEEWIKANKQRFIERYGKEKGLRVLYAKAWKDAKNESIVNEGNEKVKKAAEKAISLAKKAKGNKHVDTEPKLDVADKGTGGPMEGSHESDGEVRAKV